ncbi:MAG: hypothetical protein D6741_11060 [Planctomycetota bacterium]|nr:MAG: hypothetical protein D6741_11060 [Planctomycetota bacterium]
MKWQQMSRRWLHWAVVWAGMWGIVFAAGACRAGLVVSALGKRFVADPERTMIAVSTSDGGGSTSVRNNDAAHLVWKDEGYYQRNRDLGQVFLARKTFRLDAIVLRTGPSDAAVKPGAPGAELFVQFFEVHGEPRIDDNGTPPGSSATHGFSKNHRCDDFLTGVTYRPIRVVRGGRFPDLPPTVDEAGRPTGDTTGKLHYLRFDFTGEDELVFEQGKRYAFMVGFVHPGPNRAFTLGNRNFASLPDPPVLGDRHDLYPDGWAIRREGNGQVPPTMIGESEPPVAGPLREKLVAESLFAPVPERFSLTPTTDGYPDVDTYRDFEFYIEGRVSEKR